MTTTKNDPGKNAPASRMSRSRSARSASSAQGAVAANSAAASSRKIAASGRRSAPVRSGLQGEKSTESAPTVISACVQEELERYFAMLDGEKPSGLYRLVIRQAEKALLTTVMRECGGNQSRAAEWLGISRGNLRSKLADME